jgi:hypothetical protein
MCGPWASSKWADDGVTLSADPVFGGYRDHGYKGKVAHHTAQDLINLVEKSPNLMAIDFKGGEPMFHPDLPVALDAIIQMGRAKNICLTMTTNGTRAPEWVPRMLSQFRSVTVVVSLEAVGAMYKYIRGGDIELARVEENLRVFDRIPNLDGGINVTFSAYNLFELPNIMEWYRAMQLKAFKAPWFPPLVTPHHLNVTILPLAFRQIAAENIDLSVLPNLKPLYEILSTPSGWDFKPKEQQRHLENFVKFTRRLDAIRSTSLLDTCPIFAKLFEKPEHDFEAMKEL